jgi:hypothetical protein
MTARARTWLVALLASVGMTAIAACSTLGTPASPPGPLPHGGTGQFRALNGGETRLAETPAGATILLGLDAIENGMAAEGHFFYASASPLPRDAGMPDAGTDAGTDDAGVDDAGTMDTGPRDAGPRDAGVDANVDAGPQPVPAVDWSAYMPRAIFHSPPGASWGFAPGTMILSASAAWQGGYVTDPWVVRRTDGTYLLYFAADGGIGVATASAIDGPYTLHDGPLLPTVAEGTPRRPSAILTTGIDGAPGPILVYYELAGTIRVASSTDGLVLTDMGAITISCPVLADAGAGADAGAMTACPIAQRDDRDGNEVSIGGPGALNEPTPAGRHVLRMYYESRRDNGNVLIGMLGSEDGVHFSQFAQPMFAQRDGNRQRPAPRYVDARTTLLYTWVPGTGGRGAEIVSVTPAGVNVSGMTPTPF